MITRREQSKSFPTNEFERRRALVRALGGGMASVGVGLMLAGCGGGDGGGDSTGVDAAGGGPTGAAGSPDVPSVSASVRMAALRAAEDKCRALSQQNLAPLDRVVVSFVPQGD